MNRSGGMMPKKDSDKTNTENTAHVSTFPTMIEKISFKVITNVSIKKIKPKKTARTPNNFNKLLPKNRNSPVLFKY
jgi:hypothetical protein